MEEALNLSSDRLLDDDDDDDDDDVISYYLTFDFVFNLIELYQITEVWSN